MTDHEQEDLVGQALEALGQTPGPAEDNPPAADAAPAEGTTAEEPPAAELPDKYQGKTAEEVAAMHMALEGKLGEQGEELGELRRQLQELQQPVQQPQQYAPPRLDMDELEDALDQNPQGTVSALLNMGYGPNDPVYRHAMQSWHEQDSFAASEYHTAVMLEQQRLQFQQQYAQALQPLQQQQHTQVVTQAYYDVGQRHTDLGSYAGRIQALAEANPALAAGLAAGNPAAVEQTIENLYYIAKGQALGQGTVQETTAPSSDGTKLAASVQTAQTAPAGSRSDPEPDELVLLARKALGDMTLPD